MEPRFTLQAVQHVPVYYWPWVWWQLHWLRRCCEAAGREVLWEVCETGRVYIVAESDDPRDLTSWLRKERQTCRAHVYAMHNASGELHLSNVHYWMGRLMERGARVMVALVQRVLRQGPAVLDSS